MVVRGITYVYLMCVVGVILAGLNLFDVSKPDERYRLEDLGGKPNSPYCLQMYTSIEKYSEIYKVPKYVAYNVAYLETKYQGPFDWDYHGRLTSYAGAVGPMQIITKWAHKYAGRRITEKELRSNIDLNVMISMKMLRTRYDMYKDWALSCGGYNTGSPVVNEYARFCSTNKDYKKNWVKY
jgi:hypothetical protein